MFLLRKYYIQHGNAVQCKQIIGGSLDGKLPTYGVFKIRENRRLGNSRVKDTTVESSRE